MHACMLSCMYCIRTYTGAGQGIYYDHTREQDYGLKKTGNGCKIHMLCHNQGYLLQHILITIL